jgi:hypothetical protein
MLKRFKSIMHILMIIDCVIISLVLLSYFLYLNEIGVLLVVISKLE